MHFVRKKKRKKNYFVDHRQCLVTNSLRVNERILHDVVFNRLNIRG